MKRVLRYKHPLEFPPPSIAPPPLLAPCPPSVSQKDTLGGQGASRGFAARSANTYFVMLAAGEDFFLKCDLNLKCLYLLKEVKVGKGGNGGGKAIRNIVL